jgi:hypothetical protein
VNNELTGAVINVTAGTLVVNECLFDNNTGTSDFHNSGGISLQVNHCRFSKDFGTLTGINNSWTAHIEVEVPDPSVTPECPARPQPSLRFSVSEEFSETAARFAETGKFLGSAALNSQAVFLDTPLSFQSPDFAETGTGQQSGFLKASDGCPESADVHETDIIGDTGSIEASSFLSASQVTCESDNRAMGESASLKGTEPIRETLIIARSSYLGETVRAAATSVLNASLLSVYTPGMQESSIVQATRPILDTVSVPASATAAESVRVGATHLPNDSNVLLDTRAIQESSILQATRLLKASVVLVDSRAIQKSSIARPTQPIYETVAVAASSVAAESIPVGATGAISASTVLSDTRVIQDSSILQATRPMCETLAVAASSVATESIPIGATGRAHVSVRFVQTRAIPATAHFLRSPPDLMLASGEFSHSAVFPRTPFFSASILCHFSPGLVHSNAVCQTQSLIPATDSAASRDSGRVSTGLAPVWIAVIVAAAVLCLAAVLIILGVTRRRRQETEKIPTEAETTATFTEAMEELECENPISDDMAEAIGSGFENDADERIAI